MRQRALELVDERREFDPDNRSIVREVAEQFDVGEQSLRLWLRQRRRDEERAAAPAGWESGTTAPLDSSASREELLQRVAMLESENTRLREDNAALRRAMLELVR